MKRTDYPNMIDLVADEGKELVKVEDGAELRTNRVSCPIGKEGEWTEIEAGAEMPNEYEAALIEIVEALG